ncbi:uncharacterized protein [Symphalangus syndactylus]|uniref:uncharacterized protein isoform X2 n=1 Tax=Symphalangus syndactylus TaxID=9590 RepID=UPI003006CF6C
MLLRGHCFSHRCLSIRTGPARRGPSTPAQRLGSAIHPRTHLADVNGVFTVRCSTVLTAEDRVETHTTAPALTELMSLKESSPSENVLISRTFFLLMSEQPHWNFPILLAWFLKWPNAAFSLRIKDNCVGRLPRFVAVPPQTSEMNTALETGRIQVAEALRAPWGDEAASVASITSLRVLVTGVSSCVSIQHPRSTDLSAV